MENLRRHEVRELARLTSQLTAAQQTFFQAEYGRHRRNPTTALLLCLLLGGFGAHYFYFGRHRGGILRLLFCWTLIPAVVALFDARTITARALRYNASLANELMLALKGAVEETTSQMSPALVDAAPAAMLVAAPHASISQPAVIERVPAAASSQPAAPVAAAPSDTPVAAIPLVAMGAMAATASSPAVPVADALHTAESHPAADDAVQTAEPALAADGAVHTAVVAPADDAVQAAESHPAADALHTAESAPAADFAARFTPLAASAASDDPEDAESHLIAAAWAGREPSADDQFSHLPPFTADQRPIVPSSVPADDPWTSALPGPEWHGSPGYPYSYGADGAYESPWSFTEPQTTPPSRALAAAAWQSRTADPLLGDDPDQSRSSIPSNPLPEDLHGPISAPVPVAWERPTHPLSDSLVDGSADLREPVFMYQIAPQPRRAAVRLGPPLIGEFRDTAADMADATAQSTGALQDTQPKNTQPRAAIQHPSHGPATSAELAALGSALAAGLAELLRERPARPRTRPLTNPLAETYAPQPVAPATTTTPPAPAIEPSLDPATLTPPALPSTSWATLLPAAAPVPVTRTVPVTRPVPAADLQQPDQGLRESTTLTPAATYVTTPSLNLRRRVVQRVIVRKMAMLDGRVVAESTVERQVPVIADEAQMSARISAATNDAAREALQNLMAQAPQDALPAIRLQLYALDSASSVQNFHGGGDPTDRSAATIADTRTTERR